MSAFTVEAAGEVPGPEWRRARRQAAAEAFVAAGLPSTDEEVWRYSRIGDLDIDRYRPAALPAGGDVPAAVATTVATLPETAATVVVVDGQPVQVTLGAASDAEVHIGVPDTELADLEPADVFVTMNDAFAPGPLLVDVPAGTTVAAPVVVVHWATGGGTAAFPRLVVRLGADSEATVIELFAGADDGLVVPATQLLAGRAARLGYLGVQSLARTAWSVGNLDASADQEATVRVGLGGFGGDYARVRTDVRLEGRGSSGELVAAYFGDDDQMLDFRTFQDHVAPDTRSELVFKGAVADRSRSVYTGLIQVGKDARGTDAFQTNNNLKLSDDAWAESVPNLVIENNDVRCSHASTVGPIDEEQRFYLESRGVPTEVADRLVVEGFFDEVLDRMPGPSLRRQLDAELAQKLEAVSP